MIGASSRSHVITWIGLSALNCVGVVAPLVHTSRTSAAPTFSANAGVLSGADQEAFTSILPVSASAGAIQTFSIGDGLGTWAGESSSHAGPGFLRVSSHTSLAITDHQCCLGGGTRGGGAGAEFTIDDVLITGPGTTVSGSLNLTLSGSLDAAANYANALGGSGSYGQITVGVGIPGVADSGGARLGAGAPPANTLTLTNSGLLAGYGGGLLFLSIPSASLPVNTPFSINLELAAETVATYTVQGTGPQPVPISAEGWSRFSDTLSLAVDGPVFTLPEGYTVNSAAGAIVNNRYVGLIPEPSSGALAILVAATCVGHSYRKLRRSCHGRCPQGQRTSSETPT